ncbi:hypothetical protein [Corallococcus terminator]|uniref:hypothetical protein n=1 Tax=Corallococcus terminator TaxID=2316733 RepID=UPI0011C3E523|nr:hypothetical protein [Corallococcus terminator]
MSALQTTILAYIDEQIEAILSAPKMWGSDESVEMQVLQLLEFRSVTLRPEIEKSNPRAVLDEYHGFLRQTFPEAPPYPLFGLTKRYGRESEFISLLKRLSEHIVRDMQPDNIFASHDLVLRLWLRESVSIPRASSLSSYYEELHRVLRAVSRPTGTRGRASHELEEAIDFAMPDVIVVPANGVPAHIVLPLDQVESSRSQEVQRGLAQLVAVNDWAATSNASIESLIDKLPEEEFPERVALLAMRLVPSQEESIRMVELGGRFIPGLQPVKIQPYYAERMFTVVKERRPPQEFDEVGIIRAVDIDQRSMRINVDKRSYKCFFKNTAVLKSALESLGQRRRVSGELYRTRGSSTVVEVTNLAD